MYVSVLAIAELYRGIELLPASRRRSELEAKLAEFIDRFGERILPFGVHDAARWGRLDAQSSSNGRTLPMTDGMLAAVALERHLSIVTRNTRDFDGSGASILNPWS
uniref:Plasmid stability protein n=1 Tax=mine drainage metagenome TaxID=410659 RepID=E6Q5Y4_9ZZZZ